MKHRSIASHLLLSTALIGMGPHAFVQSPSTAADEIIVVRPKAGHIRAKQTVNANGAYVTPGFSDPHTHNIAELTSDHSETRENPNYQFQGVTTVINGNDGYGDPDIARYCPILKVRYKADIAILDPAAFTAKADFQNPAKLSEGVAYLWVNGELAISEKKAQSVLAGPVLKRCKGTQ